MAWNNGFFNSVNGDRVYNAEDMNRIFDGLITSGVYESVGNKLAVQPNSGMTIQIATGRGWFNRHWVDNDTPYLITLNASDVVLNCICAVCIRVDENDSVRTAVPYIKYSDFATSPVKPTMTRSDSINEYCLAYITIRAGATEITAADIEDARGNEAVCGWVTGLVQQLSSATLFEQWTALFNDWFIGLQDIIDSDVETKLVNALPTAGTVILSASKWSNKSQTVTVTSMNDSKSVVVQPHDDSSEVYGQCDIKCVTQANNTLTFTCETVPTSDLTVNVLHMGI